MVFGVLVPWMRGVAFLNPVLLLAYASIGLLFCAPASAEAFASAPGTLGRSEVLRRAGVILAYGWGISMLILLSGLITVNLVDWKERFFLPSWKLLLAIALFGLTACLVVISVSALLSGAWGAKMTKTVLRLGFLAILLLIAFGSRFVSDNWQIRLELQMNTPGITWLAFRGAAICAVAGFVLMGLRVARAR